MRFHGLRTENTWCWWAQHHTHHATKPCICDSSKIYLSLSDWNPTFPGSIVSPSSRLEMLFLDISSLENDNAALLRNAGVRMSITQPYIQEEHIVGYHLLLVQKQNLDSHIFIGDARRKQLWHDGRLITEDRDLSRWERRELVSLHGQSCSSDADDIKNKWPVNSKTKWDFFSLDFKNATQNIFVGRFSYVLGFLWLWDS
jgi:hypothetical protein